MYRLKFSVNRVLLLPVRITVIYIKILSEFVRYTCTLKEDICVKVKYVTSSRSVPGSITLLKIITSGLGSIMSTLAPNQICILLCHFGQYVLKCTTRQRSYL